ncbi:MAG: DUF4340 domain-containing protein, partial [Nannocystaceae bacterium]
VEFKPYEDAGGLLFESFTDPSQAAFMQVIKWNDKQATFIDFKVEFKDGRWIIPSHKNYPADGTDRMGKAAASFIDVRKDIVRSDRVDDHAEFGVLDPESPDGEAEQKGTHVVFKDEAGTVLVDAIVGKTVEGKPGFRYVRLPSEKRVYAVKLKLDISTKFEEWIEKDLLKIEREDIVELVSDAYSVDEASAKIVGSDPLVVRQLAIPPEEEGASQKDWLPAEGVVLPEGKSIDSAKIRTVIGAIDRLQIVGVRPRPERLTAGLLQSKGFFVTPDGRRLIGNEGEVQAVCKDGVVYTLYFGEVVFGEGLAVTAGVDGDAGKPADSGEAEGEKQANRYMFVDVSYDPSADRTRKKPAPAPTVEGATPEAGEGKPEAGSEAKPEAGEGKPEGADTKAAGDAP